MEPLNAYEIQELLTAMGEATSGAPVGSIWTPTPDSPNMFLILYHANMSVANDDIEHCIVMQSIPSEEAWVMPMKTFIQNNWTNLGFVWDRRAGI